MWFSINNFYSITYLSTFKILNYYHYNLPIRAMGMPLCKISTTASTADFTSENEDTPDAVCNRG